MIERLTADALCEPPGYAHVAAASTTVYVVASEQGPLAEVWEVVRASAFAGCASTLLGVSVLRYEGQLVEVEAVAVVA